MSSLLDAIRNNSQSVMQPAGVTDETNKTATLLRAKSGKGAGGSDVAQSNLGEQQAVSDTNQTMQNVVQPTANIQNQQLGQAAAGQQQQQAVTEQNISQAKKFDTIQNKTQITNTLSQLERDKVNINNQQDRAQLEQLGAQLRLTNQQYVDNLTTEGDKARLNDAAQFKEALTRTTFGDNTALLQKSLGNKSVLDVSDQQFRVVLAQMGADDSYAIFRAEQAANNQRAMWSSVGSLATAGIGAAAGSKGSGSSGTNVQEQSSNPFSTGPTATTGTNTDTGSGSARYTS